MLLAQAELQNYYQRWEEALHVVNESLNIAAPRNLKLAHSDSLIMRGKILYRKTYSNNMISMSSEVSLYEILDDLQAGLQIARGSGYVWAERNALSLMEPVWLKLGNSNEAERCRNESQTINKSLMLN